MRNGTLLVTGGLLWFGRVTPASTYRGGVAEPMFLVAIGMAMCFVPLTLTIRAAARSAWRYWERSRPLSPAIRR
jgi:hypothetical protein